MLPASTPWCEIRETAFPTSEEHAVSDIFDKAKGLIADNADKVDDVVDKVAEVVDDKTGGKHKEKIEQGADKAKDALKNLAGDQK